MKHTRFAQESAAQAQAEARCDQFGSLIIECRICGGDTTMKGTKLCDRCWELASRIRRDPEIARRILSELDQ